MQVALSVAKEGNNFNFETIGRFENIKSALAAIKSMANGAKILADAEKEVLSTDTSIFKIRTVTGKQVMPSNGSLFYAGIKAPPWRLKKSKKTEPPEKIKENEPRLPANPVDIASEEEPEFKIDWLNKEGRQQVNLNGLSVKILGKSMAFYCKEQPFNLTPFFHIGFIEGASLRLAVKFSSEETEGCFKLTLGKRESIYRNACSTLVEKIKQKMLAYKIVKKDTFQGQKNEKMGCYILSLA